MKRTAIAPLLLATALPGALLLTLLSLAVGAVPLTLQDTWHAAWSSTSPYSHLVLQLRLPRTLLAWPVGAALAVAGALVQGVTRNPLAAPDVIGVTSGAGLAAAFVVLVLGDMPLWTLPLSAFTGGLAAALLVYRLAWRGGVSPMHLVLVGVAVTQLFAAGIDYLASAQADRVALAVIWLRGSLWGRNWDHLVLALPLVPLLPAALLLAQRLNLLALGDAAAQALGVSVNNTRRQALLLAVLLASGAVAVAGTVAFIGLLAPHLARLLVGADHRRLLPLSALLGGLLLLLADTLGRGLLSPLEVPAGIMTALLGAPYFLYLLSRYRGG
ncbi:iron ABC transporter permease [Rhodoferax sp.]|uniref:FecCD family ABC transporter permease n=1 Tax=Rhodoferax sp. TaxID=50421 RepID=UPI00261C8C9D|nr:iron ABC transporter permease [Rhodoferax sp.]MDD3937887.1 iron ABC transporter permease [Rhodoferax sp.]